MEEKTNMTVGSTCVLVETGDEDPIMGVAALVSGLIGDTAGKLSKECGALLQAGKFTAVVSKIMEGSNGAALFSQAPEKDLEASVLIIGGLAQRLAATDAASCVDQLVAAALATTDRASTRATVLFQLYNMVTDLPARLAILNKTLAFVRQARLAELVAPLSRHVEDNYASWGLSTSATRTMLHDIFSMLSETSGSADPNDAAAKRVLDLQLKYLATFAQGEALDAIGEEVATAAVVSFVRSSDMMFRCDLLAYPAVQALAGTKSAPVLALLAALLTGNGVPAFAAFASQHGALFKALGLDEAECAVKMKLLALAALAEASTVASSDGEVTYAQVAVALQCGEGEVEGWIVRAVGARLVEAKMDQVRGVAVVTRVTHRVFGPQQWNALRANIDSWRENMAGVRQAVARSAESAGAAASLKEVAAH